MAKKNSCKTKISNKCGAPMSSSCVDYDSDIYRDNTTLDTEDCNTVTDVLEDLTTGLESVEDQLDFSSFGCCIEYDPADTEKGLTIKDIVKTQEALICDLQQQIDEIKDPEGDDKDCGCDDGCGKDNCCNILKSNDSLSSTIVINNDSWVNSQSGSLAYKAKEIGTYEITLEFVETSSVASTSSALLGISLDGLTPESNLFSQVTISPRHPKTVVFITKMITNTTVRVAYKRVGSTNYNIEYMKMIVKKVK